VSLVKGMMLSAMVRSAMVRPAVYRRLGVWLVRAMVRQAKVRWALCLADQVRG
jgi:hypothetical protein